MNPFLHTPGPWIFDSSPRKGTGGETLFGIIGSGKGNGLIGTTTAWWYATRMAEANAHLISAAPEMFDALMIAEARLRSAGMLGGSDDPIVAAINKARNTETTP